MGIEFKKFRVYVEKRYYSIGYIDVVAYNADDAVNSIHDKIEKGKIKHHDIINWESLVYEDNSFCVTDDVDKLYIIDF
jgi:hypothetical protein